MESLLSAVHLIVPLSQVSKIFFAYYERTSKSLAELQHCVLLNNFPKTIVWKTAWNNDRHAIKRPAFLGEILTLDIMNNKVEIRRSFTIIHSVQVTLPDSYRIGRIPEPSIGSSEFGTFEITFTEGVDNTIHIYRKVVIRKGDFKDEKFKECAAPQHCTRLSQNGKVLQVIELILNVLQIDG